MSGWGRSGEWFAMDLWNVTPDILCTAKGITSAYVPLGLCATSEKIGDFFQDHYFSHGHTYEAHPMTLLPAVATIHEMQRLGLVERSRELGPFVEQKLNVLKAKHRSVGDVRGKGLFWAVDLVKNQKTKRAIQHLRRQGLRQTSGRRSDCSQNACGRRDFAGLGQSLRHRATIDHYQGRDRTRGRYARQVSELRRRAMRSRLAGGRRSYTIGTRAWLALTIGQCKPGQIQGCHGASLITTREE